MCVTELVRVLQNAPPILTVAKVCAPCSNMHAPYKLRVTQLLVHVAQDSLNVDRCVGHQEGVNLMVHVTVWVLAHYVLMILSVQVAKLRPAVGKHATMQRASAL
jgi:hypothetical protein